MKEFATVTLDIVYDETLFDAITDLVAGATIVATIVRERGSAGGGWPEVAFAGTTDDLMTMLTRYCGGDLELALDEFERVEACDRATWGGQTVF